MKRVIIATYQFPPSGGKAVQRAVKLAKYLPAHGWRPVIFTMPAGDRGVPVDRSLMDGLPDDLDIHRPPWRDWWRLVPHDLRKLLHRPLPDRYRDWADSAAEPLVRLIRDSAADALITTSPSHSVQMLGLAVKRRTGIPWAADFRDPWSGHEDFPGKPGAEQMRRDETAVITEADAVVGVYPKILRGFRNRVSDEKLHLIENGYDEDDFRLVDRELPAGPGPLLLGYNGTVSRYHDPTTLLETVRGMLTRNVIGPGSMRFVFTTNAGSRKWFGPFRDLADAGILEVRDYLPHAESLAQLAATDVSVVISTRGRDIYPAKVFEYFYLGNPVLMVGDTADDLAALIRDTSTGVVADTGDPVTIEDALLVLMERKQAGKLHRLKADTGRIERFSRRRIAGRYAALLDSIVQ